MYDDVMQERREGTHEEALTGRKFTEMGLSNVLNYHHLQYKGERVQRILVDEASAGDMVALITTGALSLDEKVERLRLFLEVTEGLADIHAKEYCVPDLKPDNVFLHETNGVRHAKLADFGGTAPKGSPLGANTPEYAAPETMYNKPISRANDMWAMGTSLHNFFYGPKHRFDKQQKIAKKLGLQDLSPQQLIDALFDSLYPLLQGFHRV